jgi:hypothetical protein
VCFHCKTFFSLQYHHMSLMDSVVSLPGCDRSVTDFWGWDAHEALLRCPDEVDGDTVYEYEVPWGALNLSSTKPWSPWESSPSRKNPNGTTGNQTRDLKISSQKLWPLDHDAGHYTKYLSRKTEWLGITYWKVQGDQKVCVNLMYSNNHHIIDDLKIDITEYIRNMDRAILSTIFENTARGVNNVWRLAGDTLNTTCNFLYCNHQVNKDLLITMYKEQSKLGVVSRNYSTVCP